MAERETERLPERDELPREAKWRLENIYASDEAWERDFQQVQTRLGNLSAAAEGVTEAGSQFLATLQLRDELFEVFERLYAYARMRRDEESTRERYQGLTDRAESLGAELRSAASFIEPAILAVNDEAFDRLTKEEPGLAAYDHYLADVRRLRPHTLDAAQERLLALANEVFGGPRTIFTMLNDADLSFPTIRNEEDRPVELTKGRYLQFMQSRNRRVRREAFTALYETYAKSSNTLAATLAASIKKDVYVARVRQYGSSLEAALSPDNVPVQLYETLIETTHRHLPLLHRYMRLRRRALELDELHMWDLYAPIVPEGDFAVDYDEACRQVLASCAPLGPAYAQVVERSFEDGWIDVYESRGKSSGAYSWGAYGVHPFILMNYQGKLRDLFTLAHELGHALHSYYSHRAQPYVYAHYTIFVAEVASTLNEMLLTRHLLEVTEDRARRLYILNNFLEDFRGTVIRQVMFAEFEQRVHGAAEAGEPLTAAALSRIYRELNETYFGPEVVVDEPLEQEWARIPHFYRAFYVYKYATGFCAAAALAGRIHAEGDPAVERYLAFLAGGGSDYPLELLRGAGVDMTETEPLDAGFAEFARVLDELDAAL